MKEADSVVASAAAITVPSPRAFDASVNGGPGAVDVHLPQHHATRPVGGEERPGGGAAADGEGVPLTGCCACRRGGMDANEGREDGRRCSSVEACSCQGMDGGGSDKVRELSRTPPYHHHRHPGQQQHPQQHLQGTLEGTLSQGGGGAGPGRSQDPTPTSASRESAGMRTASSRGLSPTEPGNGCRLWESGKGPERRGIEMEDLEAALEGFSAESVRGAGLFASSVEWGDVGGLCGVRAELREILEVHTVVCGAFCVHSSWACCFLYSFLTIPFIYYLVTFPTRRRYIHAQILGFAFFCFLLFYLFDIFFLETVGFGRRTLWVESEGPRF